MWKFRCSLFFFDARFHLFLDHNPNGGQGPIEFSGNDKEKLFSVTVVIAFVYIYMSMKNNSSKIEFNQSASLRLEVFFHALELVR